MSNLEKMYETLGRILLERGDMPVCMRTDNPNDAYPINFIGVCLTGPSDDPICILSYTNQETNYPTYEDRRKAELEDINKKYTMKGGFIVPKEAANE